MVAKRETLQFDDLVEGCWYWLRRAEDWSSDQVCVLREIPVWNGNDRSKFSYLRSVNGVDFCEPHVKALLAAGGELRPCPNPFEAN